MRGTTRFLERWYVRSSFFLLRGVCCPECAELSGIPLPRRIERRDSAAIECHLRAPMKRWNALRDQTSDGVCNLRCIVVDQCIGQAHCVSLLPTIDCPDKCVIARVEFVDSGLLFDHFWPVHSKSSFACHNDIAAEACGERHASEASDSAGRNTDYGGMLPQYQNGGHDFCDCRFAKIGLLKTHTAGLEQNHRASRYAFLVVDAGQVESGSHFSARHLSQAAALKSSLEGNYHCCLPPDLSFHHHTAVVFLWRDALHREPGRFHTIEGTKQLARYSRIEERFGPLSCVEFDKALPVDEVCVIFFVAHRSLTSTACSRRSWTLPGVPPASLI